MATIDQQAAAQAAAQLAPVLAEIKRQTAEEKQRATNQQATAGASAHGLSQILGEIPGQIQQTYKQAGDSTAAYAKGFSAAFTQDSNATAEQMNAFLAKQGSPGQVQAAGQAGGDVLYGLGGFLPAAGLAREGAAFSSAAEGLGAGALLRGQETQALIGRDSTQKLSQLDALVRAEKAKLPALTQQIKQQERGYQLDLKQDARAERGERRADRELTLRERQANEKQLQVFGSGETGFMSFDPKTGRTTRLTDPVPAGAGAPELIGSSDSGYYAWDAGTGTITPVLGAAEKPKFTPTQTREIKKDAANMAYDAFWGIKDKEGEVTGKPMHYQQAMAWMLDQQIPLDVAQKALNRWWTKPGQAADIKSRLEGKPYWFKPTQKGVTGRPLKAIQERKPQGDVDPVAEAAANADGGTTVLGGKSVPGWNDKSIPPQMKNVLAIAHAQVGKPYVWGGDNPSEGGFDCSGLIEYAYEQAGIKTPGRLTTWSMMQLGKPVNGPLKPGDWVITNGGKHVVMYVGKGKVIAAPRRGEVVQYQDLSRFKGQIVATRRFGS